jgi:hypothetical protein
MACGAAGGSWRSADCCADRDPEVHRVLMEKVFARQTTVVRAEEIAAMTR